MPVADLALPAVNDPSDPSETVGGLSPLHFAAVAIHEIYCSLVAGGFEEWQALRIVAHLLAEEAAE